jgi:hypothetical protein
VNPDELLRFIKENLEKQKHENQYGQERLAQFVETRIKELETGVLNTPN